MATRVLAAAKSLPTSVVCDDVDVAAWAEAHSASVIWRPGLGLNGAVTDAVEEIRRITGSGVDYALDTTGLPALIRQGVDALRQRGTVAVLGASRPEDTLDIPANAFMQSCKTIVGVVEGNSVADVFVPQLVDLFALLVNQKLRVTDDVDEQDVADIELYV